MSMTADTGAVDRYRAAMTLPSDEALAALIEVLADDVTSAGPFGPGQGKDGVATALSNPMATGILGLAEWADATSPHPGMVEISASLPVGMMAASGINSMLWFDEAGAVRRVVQELVMAPPPPPTPIVFTADIRSVVNAAVDAGRPMVAAYVSPDGVPHVSPRGSTHVHSDDQLAFWVRNPNGGLLRALTTNPNLTFFYRDNEGQVDYTFIGRAHVEVNDSIRERVYHDMPQIERDLDPMQRGVAVIHEVDQVDGGDLVQRIRMERT